MSDLPFHLYCSVEGRGQEYVASFGDYRMARVAAMRRLSMLDFRDGLDAPQVNYAAVFPLDEPVPIFEAVRDSGRVIVQRELLEPVPSRPTVRV